MWGLDAANFRTELTVKSSNTAQPIKMEFNWKILMFDVYINVWCLYKMSLILQQLNTETNDA